MSVHCTLLKYSNAMHLRRVLAVLKSYSIAPSTCTKDRANLFPRCTVYPLYNRVGWADFGN